MRNILIFIYCYIDEIEQLAVKTLFRFRYIMVCMLVNIAVFIIVNYLQNECIYRHSQFYEKYNFLCFMSKINDWKPPISEVNPSIRSGRILRIFHSYVIMLGVQVLSVSVFLITAITILQPIFYLSKTNALPVIASFFSFTC